jgi:predicted metalloprotease
MVAATGKPDVRCASNDGACASDTERKMAASAAKAMGPVQAHLKATRPELSAPPVVITRKAASPCGEFSDVDDTERYVGYCPSEKKIYMGDKLLQANSKAANIDRDSMALMVLAHETGHAVRNPPDVYALSRDQIRREENYADCYAGAVVGHAQAQPGNSVKPGQVQGMKRILTALGGDAAQMRRNEEDGPNLLYGTAKTRVGWFETGIREGATACERAIDE